MYLENLCFTRGLLLIEVTRESKLFNCAVSTAVCIKNSHYLVMYTS